MKDEGNRGKTNRVFPPFPQPLLLLKIKRKPNSLLKILDTTVFLRQSFHPSSFILHPSSFIFHLSSFIFHLSSFIFHLSSFILHPSSFILHSSSFLARAASYLAINSGSRRFRLS